MTFNFDLWFIFIPKTCFNPLILGRNLVLDNSECCSFQTIICTFVEQVKAYREYVVSKKSLELLSEEDRFMYQLSRAERLSTKLNVMYYIGNFFDNIHLITPVSEPFVRVNFKILVANDGFFCSKFKLSFHRHDL